MIVCFNRPHQGIQALDEDYMDIVNYVASEDGLWNLVFSDTANLTRRRSGFTIVVDNPDLYKTLKPYCNTTHSDWWLTYQTPIYIFIAYIIFIVLLLKYVL